jgi:hypothetical protein
MLLHDPNNPGPEIGGLDSRLDPKAGYAAARCETSPTVVLAWPCIIYESTNISIYLSLSLSIYILYWYARLCITQDHIHDIGDIALF